MFMHFCRPMPPWQLMSEQVSKLPAGHEIVVEPSAGAGAGYADADYVAKGARMQPGAVDGADLVLKVRTPTSEEIGRLREGATLVGLMAPLSEPQAMRALAAQGVTTFALELLPRISRAQSMDALSAMATIAGYKSVLEKNSISEKDWFSLDARMRAAKLAMGRNKSIGEAIPAHIQPDVDLIKANQALVDAAGQGKELAK